MKQDAILTFPFLRNGNYTNVASGFVLGLLESDWSHPLFRTIGRTFLTIADQMAQSGFTALQLPLL